MSARWPHRGSAAMNAVLAVVSAMALIAVGLIAFRKRTPPDVELLHASAQSPAFDLSNSTIPLDRIEPGGVPKDGIPALTRPAFVEADSAGAEYLDSNDRVVGIIVGGQARAYPIRLLTFHEIVNDRIDDKPIAVTYCPLCDSVAAYDARVAGRDIEFGVSGLLHNSNVLMFDRGAKVESLWSQMKSQAVSGPLVNSSLRALPVELTTWRDWRTRQPKTRVLSSKTSFDRPYDANPYASYFASDDLMFPIDHVDKRLPPKHRVLGLWKEGESLAVPLSSFKKSGAVEVLWKQQKVQLFFDREARSLRVENADPGVQWMYSYWFAWAAFRPSTELHQPVHP